MVWAQNEDDSIRETVRITGAVKDTGVTFLCDLCRARGRRPTVSNRALG